MHKRIDDVHHLLSHSLQGNDVFVTEDTDMLKKRDELRNQVGIVVERPAEALKRARQLDAKEQASGYE